jgi:hypothetical protein
MGRRFQAVLARLGTPTGDGRILSPGGITSRDLPIPLSWQEKSAPGHDGSVVVARIETVEFHQDMITATGQMLDVPDAWQAETLIEAGVIGPSLDLSDDIVYVVDDAGRTIITSAVFGGATLVPIEAFADVSITLEPLPAEPMMDDVSRETSAADVEWGMYAAAGLRDVSRETLPPLEAFTRPDTVGPVTVSRETWGERVSGYVATWGTCHIGLPGCTTAPTSATAYAHFLRQEERTATGESVPVGVLTVGGGHADPSLGVIPAMAHYDDVGAAVARVFAGEDEHGIWVSGYVPPYADRAKVQQLADLDVSGDWRRVGGNLELVAVCAVNTPGFPVLRKVHFSIGKGGQSTLIGQFKVEPRTVESSDVSRETSKDDARARWAWANRKV